MATTIVHDRKDFQKQKRKKLTKHQEKKLREKLWKEQNGLCARCDMPLTKGDTIFNTAHLKHKKSKGSGGHDTEENRELVHGWECHMIPDHSPRWTKGII